MNPKVEVPWMTNNHFSKPCLPAKLIRLAIALAVFLLCLPTIVRAEARDKVAPAVNLKAEPFDLSEVKRLDGPFKIAQQSMGDWILNVNPDRLLAYPRREAGLAPKADPQPMPSFNWGACVGHHLSACSMMWQATGDAGLLDRINYLVAGLAECQQANGDGYCGGVSKSREGFAKLKNGQLVMEPAGGFNGMEGVPWYNMHKIFAGLIDAYRRCGTKPALTVLTALADWCESVTKNLSDQAMQQMLSVEHGGMAEALADVYALTGEKRYLDLAKRFRHLAVFTPMLENRDTLPGLHANCTIPKFTAYERLYELTGNMDDHTAALNFWHFVVNHHSYLIGANSKEEYFFKPDQWEDSIRSPLGPESCNTYNLLKLTSRLFRADPQPGFMDYAERSMFNHVLATVNPRTGGRVYFTALCPMAYRTSDPVSTACCGYTVLELHYQAHELIYARSANALWVNLFIPSEVRWTSRSLTLTQETQFPYEPKTTLRIATAQPQKFDLMLRRPAWAGLGYTVSINGKPVEVTSKPGEYLCLSREWSGGDEVSVDLPMRLSAEPLKNSSKFAAILAGPIVLAADHGALNFPELYRTAQKGTGPYGQPEAWPVLVGSLGEIPGKIEPVAGEPMHFKTKDLARPVELTLKPFLEMAEERYSVYMPLMDEAAWKDEAARRTKFAEAEKCLNVRTLDKLAYDEKDNWAAHNLTKEWWGLVDFSAVDGMGYWGIRPNPGSEIGCDLKVNPKGDNELFLRIWEGEGEWRARILVEGKLLAEARRVNATATGRREITWQIPAEFLAGKEKIAVKVQSSPWVKGPCISEIRTLKWPSSCRTGKYE